MKKIIVCVIAAFVGIIGAAPTFALVPTPTPEQCAESDTAPPGCPIAGADYPVVNPDSGTVPETVPPATTTPAIVPVANLPKTGSSGTTTVLQIAALALTGGLIVLVAARRRTAAVPAA